VLRSEFGFKKCLMYSDRLQSPNEEYKEVKKLFDLNIAETK